MKALQKKLSSLQKKWDNAKVLLLNAQQKREEKKKESKLLVDNALAEVEDGNLDQYSQDLAKANSESDTYGGVIGILQAEVSKAETAYFICARELGKATMADLESKAQKRFEDGEKHVSQLEVIASDIMGIYNDAVRASGKLPADSAGGIQYAGGFQSIKDRILVLTNSLSQASDLYHQYTLAGIEAARPPEPYNSTIVIGGLTPAEYEKKQKKDAKQEVKQEVPADDVSWRETYVADTMKKLSKEKKKK